MRSPPPTKGSAHGLTGGPYHPSGRGSPSITLPLPEERGRGAFPLLPGGWHEPERRAAGIAREESWKDDPAHAREDPHPDVGRRNVPAQKKARAPRPAPGAQGRHSEAGNARAPGRSTCSEDPRQTSDRRAQCRAWKCAHDKRAARAVPAHVAAGFLSRGPLLLTLPQTRQGRAVFQLVPWGEL